MSESGKSRKSLLVGIIAAVVILAGVLGVLLSQCSGGDVPAGTTDGNQATEPVETTAPVVQGDGRLYWNLDRREFDGLGDNGTSSRSKGSDGYYHIRFFVDGAIVELPVKERHLMNRIDTMDLMGLVFENGAVVDAIDMADMTHVKKVGWKFYVQSIGGDLLKLNSSDKFNGVEVLLDLSNGAKVYDMSGFSAELGSEALPVANDRVMAVSDLNDNLLAVYIYDRSNMVVKVDGYCQHCDKEVLWTVWDKDSTLPNETGHYRISKDIQLKSQLSMKDSVELCIDLNGKTITAAEGKRVISLHNMNTRLAIMDTSEEKTGKLVAHGESTDQGRCVWVRYGAFYLYDGMLDASQAVCTGLGGTAVYVAKGSFFYMNGGEVVGGTAQSYEKENGKYAGGAGGAIQINGGKMVLNDGVVRDGVAKSYVDWQVGSTPYKRGYAGNIFVSSGVLEINGGVVMNGRAGIGGNIFLDGTSEFTMKGGEIVGGMLMDPGRNGGNLYINTKAKAVISGGRICDGTTMGASGNIHLAGTLTMNGGIISGGRILDSKTGEEQPTRGHRNMYVANGAEFYMSGGWIYGGVAAVDSSVDDGKKTTVWFSGVATIADGPEGSPNFTLVSGKDTVKVVVGPMTGSSRIGISASGVFSEKTDVSNLSHFFSDKENVDVVHVDGCLAVGKLACLCGSTTETHMGACDGTQLLWSVWSDSKNFPGKPGNHILTTDINITKQHSVGSSEDPQQVINVNLNGHSITSTQRAVLVYSKLNLVDHVGGGVVTGAGLKSGNDHTGVMLLYGGSEVSLYAGTLKLADTHYDLTNGGVVAVAAGAKFTMYGGIIDGRSADTEHTVQLGGAVRVHGTMTVDGGVIYGGTVTGNEHQGRGATFLVEKTGSLTLNGGEIYGGNALNEGGAIYVTGEEASFTMNGGTLYGGNAGREGGAIRMLGNSTVNILGGTVTGGVAGSKGGNISVVSGTLTIGGNAKVEKGNSTGIGGNISVNGGTLNLQGGTVTGGKVKGSADNHSANIAVENCTVNVSGGTVTGGFLVMNTTSANAAKIVLSGSPVITKEITYGLRLFSTEKATAQPVIQVEGLLGEDASVTVSSYGILTGQTKEDNLEKFVSGMDDAKVSYVDQCIFVGQVACLCGEETCFGACSGEKLLWMPWTSTNSLPTTPGNYYLIADVNVTANAIGSGDGTVNLNLNGHHIIGKKRAMTTTGTINIVDHVGTGTVIGAGNSSLDHSGVVLTTAGTRLSLYSGTLKLADVHNDLTNGGVMAVVEGAQVNVYGGVIDGRSTDTQHTVQLGGAVRLHGTMIVDGGKIYGGTVTGNENQGRGAAFFIEKTGSLTFNSGDIYGGNALNEGGAIYITGAEASFTMNGGTLHGGNAGKEGGAIRMLGNTTVNILGGTVTDGVANGKGGNISAASGTLTIGGNAKVEKGNSIGIGGNIHFGGGTLNLQGGTVTGGVTASTGYSANIGVSNAAVVISGGTVEGAFLVMNTNTSNSATVTISGSPVITRNDGWGLSLCCMENATVAPVLTVENTLGAGASIALNVEMGVFTGATNAENKDKFILTDDQILNQSLQIGVNSENCLYVGQAACLCGSATHKSYCDQVVRIWQPWDGKTAITASGSYMLTADVTNSGVAAVGEAGKALQIELNLNGHTISNNNGRSLNVYSNLKIVDHDAENRGTILGVGANGDHSAAMVIRDGAVVDLYDGTVKLAANHAKLGNLGGVISILANSTLNIWPEGEVDASASLTSANTIGVGGAIRVVGNLNIKGGTVIGGAVTGNAGTLFINGGTVNMESGAVFGGVADGLGGNIYMASGVLNITGGTVGSTDLPGKMSANIYAAAGQILVNGATLSGGMVVDSATLTLAGNTRIQRVNGCGLSLENTVITLGALTDASIDIDSTGYITAACDQNYGSMFHVAAGNGVEYDATKQLYVGKAMCLCGNADGHKEWCDRQMLIWRPWDGNATITSGNYYLTQSVTAGDTLTINGDVNLDLNGCTYAANTRGVLLDAGDVLRIVDTKSGGAVTGKATVSAGNGGLFSVNNAKVYLYGGSFKLEDNHNAVKEGGVFVVSSTNGELHIYDGVTIGSTTATGTVDLGGAIRVAKGKVYIHGGTVIGHSNVADDKGSAIYAKDGATVEITGGSVNNGNIYMADGTLTLNGKVQLEKVTLAEGKKLTLGADLTADSSVAVDMAVAGVFADGVAAALEDVFTSANSSYMVFRSGNNGDMSLLQHHIHSGVEYSPIEKWASHKTTITAGGGYYLNWNDSSAQTIVIDTTEPVILCLNGAKIFAGQAITVCEGADLTICDCIGGGSVATSGSSTKAPIYLNVAAAVKLQGVTITSSRTGVSAAHICNANATLTVSDTTFTGDVLVEAGSLLVGANVTVSGDIHQTGGLVEDNGAVTFNALRSLGGNLVLSDSSVVGSLILEGGNVRLTGAVQVTRLDVLSGSLSIENAAVISDLYLAKGNTVTLSGDGVGASAAVTMEEPGIIADVADTLKAPYAGFTTTQAGQTIGLQGGYMVMGTKGDHQHCYCVNAEAVPEGHLCDTLRIWNSFDKKSADATSRTSGSYFLNWTGYSGQSLVVGEGQEVYLCLNGAEIRGQKVVQLGANSILHITDCKGSGLIRPSNPKQSTITLDGSKQVRLYSGTISGLGTSGNPSTTTINFTSASASFYMYGGTISGGEGSGNGGNVMMGQGYFEMNGGTITGGVSTNGGNVALNGGTAKFVLNNGIISGGHATNRGGNIYMQGGNTRFEMNGGTVTGGISDVHGGNVLMTRGTFTMNGGTVTSGVAAQKGGNVMLLPAASLTFTMNGGKILGGNVSGVNAENGGNVCVNGADATKIATFIMTAGEISGGKVSANGANIYVELRTDVLILPDGAVDESTIYFK